MGKEKTKNEVFKNHKKLGKKLIPPMIAQLGSLTEYSWKDQIIPEIIWTAILNKSYGYKDGAELSVFFSLCVSKALEKEKREWFVKISSYSKLTEKEISIFLSILNKGKENFQKIKDALIPLIFFYPECSLNFLFSDNEIYSKDKNRDLRFIRGAVDALIDKTSKFATFAQANILYIGFNLGKLHVNRNTSLAEFPKIQEYPETEISRRIAANVRASMGHLFIKEDGPNEWAEYFWRRGMEIDHCIF